MSRRRRAVKREILPDPKFGDVVITRFMNALMYDGKKSAAETIVYGALDVLKRRGGNQADPVRWLTSASDLLIGTLSQEFAAFGGGLGDPITPSNTRIVPQSGEGASDVQPIKVGLETLFVNRAGRRIFALASRPDAGGCRARCSHHHHHLILIIFLLFLHCRHFDRA